MTIKETFKTGRAPVKIWTHDIEASARRQLEDLSTLPFIHSHIAVMPDVHMGIGSTVGSVVPTIKAIVPAAVGVDIGCGMIAAPLSITPEQLPDGLGGIRHAIECAVPHGRTDNGGKLDRGAWHNPSEEIVYAHHQLALDARMRFITERHPKLFSRNHDASVRQLGTLGTGNHFIELCIDKENKLWIMLHSGSRGTGNRIGMYFINQAKELMERYHIELPDPDLAFIPEAEPIFTDYWKALSWAQDYAAANRTIMFVNAIKAIEKELGIPVETHGNAVNCHHNYVSLENHYDRNVYVTRKGAVRVQKGELGIIPGSMGARSFIVRGLGNPEAFDSCSHGAGRRMSRGEARRRFTPADLALQTAGVECRKDADVVDEIPGAYKDIQTVMDNQSDLVEVVAELRQLVCVKG